MLAGSKRGQNPQMSAKKKLRGQSINAKKPGIPGFFDGSGDGSDRSHKRAPAHSAGNAGYGPSGAPKAQSGQIERRSPQWN